MQRKMKRILPLVFFFILCQAQGQYSFSGEILDPEDSKTVYLSIIEDYRKLSRIYLEQIISKTTTDSLGRFKFKGNNLLDKNRIYRIHIDGCSDLEKNTNHFFGQCDNSESILFIANNLDTIAFPSTYTNEALCDISSTNLKSNVFLQIDTLKEEMIYDFSDYRSEASRKLNSKKWFATFQDFGKSLKEPLAELYIYDFLSDKRNETYSYYLQDLINNPYYSELLERLKNKHPNTSFTQLYEAEILTDKQFLSFKDHTKSIMDWKWILASFLVLSLSLNIYLFTKQKLTKKKENGNALKKLTQQEQKIIAQILANKTNKEIASEMFISLSTVKTHINNLYKKLNVTTREDIKHVFSKKST